MRCTARLDPHYGRFQLLKKRDHLPAPKLPAQNRAFVGSHPMQLKNMLRRIHANADNLVHGRLPLSEILQRPHSGTSMPSGAVHTIRGDTDMTVRRFLDSRAKSAVADFAIIQAEHG
jgi:hypothetical protein